MKHEFESIINNYISNTSKTKKPKILDKIRETEFIIPKYTDYKIFKNKNYRVTFLKDICKFYKLKICGNKPELKNRIYYHLHNSNYAIIIQKSVRRYFVKLYNKLIGPALYKRTLCMNSTDFFSLENLTNIPYNEFFSYKYDNNIWGFNILSIYNLFIKSRTNVLNPYTREILDYSIFLNIKHIIKLSHILKKPVNIVLNNNRETITAKKKIEMKCLDLFQHMDELGNYTDSKWFLNLNKMQLIKFVRDLIDIWEYRAQLDFEVKKEICYPFGDPFRYTDLINFVNLNYISLQKTVLSIIEQFIKKGIDRDASNLGASYILCGLTLVNNDAAIALPWLYQSVVNLE